MKKIFLTLIVLGLLLSSVFSLADQKYDLTKVTVFSSKVISANGSAESDSIPLDGRVNFGNFSLQVLVQGSGVCKFEYLVSIDGRTYVEPSSAIDIATGVNGSDIFSFYTVPCKYLKIKVTETGGASQVTVTANLLIQ